MDSWEPAISVWSGLEPHLSWLMSSEARMLSLIVLIAAMLMIIFFKHDKQ